MLSLKFFNNAMDYVLLLLCIILWSVRIIIFSISNNLLNNIGLPNLVILDIILISSIGLLIFIFVKANKDNFNKQYMRYLILTLSLGLFLLPFLFFVYIFFLSFILKI